MAGVSMRGRRRGGSATRSLPLPRQEANQAHLGAARKSQAPPVQQAVAKKATKKEATKVKKVELAPRVSETTNMKEVAAFRKVAERPIREENHIVDRDRYAPPHSTKPAAKPYESAVASSPYEDEDDEDDDYKEDEEYDEDEDEEGGYMSMTSGLLPLMEVSKEAKDDLLASMDDEDLLFLNDPALANELAEELKVLLQDSENENWLDFDGSEMVDGDNSNMSFSALKQVFNGDGGSGKISAADVEDNDKGAGADGDAKTQKAAQKLRRLSRPPSPTVTNTVYESTTPLQKTARNRQAGAMVVMYPQHPYAHCPVQQAHYDGRYPPYAANSLYYGPPRNGEDSRLPLLRMAQREGIKDDIRSAGFDGGGQPSINEAGDNMASPKSKKGQEGKEAPYHEPPPATLDSEQVRHIEDRQRREVSNLLEQFHQVLTQQAVLAVRKAHVQKKAIPNRDQGSKSGHSNLGYQESPDDLALILDGAVGMLQELDELRKDSIRNVIWYEDQEDKNEDGRDEVDGRDGELAERGIVKAPSGAYHDGKKAGKEISKKKKAQASHEKGKDESEREATSAKAGARGVLTRAAFMKMLEGRYHRMVNADDTDADRSSEVEVEVTSRRRNDPGTVFDINGLARLKETFKSMDESVSNRKSSSTVNILEPEDVS
jgi:hypothetical protein